MAVAARLLVERHDGRHRHGWEGRRYRDALRD